MALLQAYDGGADRRHAAASRHLAQADPVMRDLIACLGPCRLTPRRHYFPVLCDAIISQQLSAKVAATIFDRFAALYPKRRPTPSAVTKTPRLRLKAAGLSGQKVRYVKELAAGFQDGRIQMHRLVRRSNADIIRALVSIAGIGRWTAEMFLIFSLNRLDVLPLQDLGIRKAVQRCYRLRALPTMEKLHAIGRIWHPYESVASWFLWQSLHIDTQPIFRGSTRRASP